MNELERQMAVDIVQITSGLIAIAFIVLAVSWRHLAKHIKRVDSKDFSGLKRSAKYAFWFSFSYWLIHFTMAITGAYWEANVQIVWSWIVISTGVLTVLLVVVGILRSVRSNDSGVDVDRSTAKFDPLTIAAVSSLVMFVGSLICSSVAIVSSLSASVGITTGDFRPQNLQLAGWFVSNAGAQIVYGLGFLGATFAISLVPKVWFDSDDPVIPPTGLLDD